ncbi:hypothetical protein ACQEU3_44170 [Spirillospora sp. CA-253888]
MSIELAGWLTVIATWITALGVVVAAGGLHQAARQRVLSFEGFYIQRYWQLMDRLSYSAMCGHALEDDDEKTIVAYLMLCEDELDLRAAGWISHDTWQVWQSGIKSCLQRELFGQVWRELARDRQRSVNLSGGDFARLRAFENGEYDPYCPKHWLEPYLRGLQGLSRRSRSC